MDIALGDLRNKISAHGSASETSIRKVSTLGVASRFWVVAKANRENIATKVMRSTISSAVTARDAGAENLPSLASVVVTCADESVETAAELGTMGRSSRS